jgi:hypothetical protein
MAIINYLGPLRSNYLELFPTWNDGNISEYQIPLRIDKMAKIKDMREVTTISSLLLLAHKQKFSGLW